MNNVEIEDVYHHDFTTASEWEVFIARLEEIIHEWQLPHAQPGPPLKEGDFANLSWEEHTEKLNFADVEFFFKYFKLQKEDDGSERSRTPDPEEVLTQCQKDILNSRNDFVQIKNGYPELARFYGIREFLLLVPVKQNSIADETKMKILLSSLTIAVSNAQCEIAAFVQVQEQWQNYYLGINIGKGSRMHLNMVHLKKIPPHCRHLTGLSTLFKQKISEGCGSGVGLDTVIVSVRLSYTLKDWTNSTWTQEPPDFDFLQGETLGVDELGKLPFGATFDPINWSEISENAVVESESFSDLEPLSAPDWSLKVEMVRNPACLLGEYLSNFLQLCGNQKSLVELLGEGAAYVDNENQSLSSAFNILTESRIPSLTTVVSRNVSKSRKNIEGPITEDVLLPILYFLFPDAEDNTRAPYDSDALVIDEDQWRGIKTCAIDSLVWRLAIVASHCAFNLGSVNALAQLWHEFVQELRFRWERGIPVPGIGPGFPDCVRTCLLHQKLQMINCCIARKKTREECERREMGLDQETAAQESTDDSEDDEFFECLNEEEAEARRQSHQQHLPWNRPVGRLAKHPTLRLIQTGEPLYLPVTQDPVPKTEDQLEEDAQVMMQLGTDKTASEMRARLMSASLLSDMESFKAANPNGQLEDFIRWYSPRDWIEDDQGEVDEWGQARGRLSARMLIDKNPWSSTWESAQPVPAHRQKRLFDDTREAEKALHYLGSRRLGQLAQLLMPVLAHAALVTLHEQKYEALTSLPSVLQTINNRLQFATKPIHQKMQIYEDIVHEIESIESLIAQFNSLRLKLTDSNGDKDLTSFIGQLMHNREVSVPNGPRGAIGARITKMFSDAQKAAYMTNSMSTESDSLSLDTKFKPFPEPSAKEFILRTMAPRPTPSSSLQPQRLYVSLHRDGIRMAGAFSEDTIFY
ncbi:rab3 GTPase-activating protein catalytic subunit isoform X2 [Copidosoma floridanum]|uniref:rab3 GTPase-activating protein catalytic subunit isoform X2 n=1 Tax=Copidosoma floridanum TaxID=29053 RepID=UPI0006C9C69A|nr:rab3 GTPase-activating protein catalytic subunit isoform X2 [Copidosoma floridanum]